MTQLLQNAETVPIKYIGPKAEKHDTVNHTSTIWKPGQTLYYPLRLAKALLLHPAVWRLGDRRDIGAEDAKMDKVIGADAQVTQPTEGASGGTARHPEESVPVSELVKDREPSTKGRRATLE